MINTHPGRQVKPLEPTSTPSMGVFPGGPASTQAEYPRVPFVPHAKGVTFII